MSIHIHNIKRMLQEGTLKSKDLTNFIKNVEKKSSLEKETSEEKDAKNAETIANGESISMGLGAIGGNIIWPRVFRFTVASKQEQQVNVFMQKFEFNLKQNTINLHVFEGNYKIYDWIKHLILGSDELTLTTYDGCGKALYIIKFNEVTSESHNVKYDYSKSDVVTHELELKFESAKRVDLIKEETQT